MGMLNKVTRRLDQAGVWYGWIVALTGSFAWLSKQLTVLNGIGWPEAIFLGLAVAVLLMLSVTASLALWRVFKPLPATSISIETPLLERSEAAASPADVPLEGKGLFVADTYLNVEKLESDHVIEIVFRYFNASGRNVVAYALTGQVRATARVEGVETEIGKLPVASLLRDRAPPYPIPTLSESLVVIEQPIRPAMVPLIQDAIKKGQAWFYFSDLNIMIHVEDNVKLAARLPIWEAATLSIAQNSYQTGRVNFITAHISL